MPSCVPIRDLKDTAKFSALVESSSEPVLVTKNGRESFVVMSTDNFAAMSDEVVKAKLLSRMMLAERELAADDYVESSRFIASVRERYGL